MMRAWPASGFEGELSPAQLDEMGGEEPGDEFAASRREAAPVVPSRLIAFRESARISKFQ